MTVSSTTNKIQYTGNGATVAFGFPYLMFAASDLLVTLYDTTANADVSPAPVLNGAATYDYTFAGTFDANLGEYTAGGTITFTTAPPANYRVTIERVVPQTQAVTLIDNSKFPANTVNGALDRLTVLVQRVSQLVGQALRYPSSDPSSVSAVMPSASDRASKYLAFDSSGNPIASPGPSATGQPISSFWATTIQIATAALSRVALGVPGLADNNTFSGTNTFNGTVGGSGIQNQSATAPTYQEFLSGTAATYTTPAGVKWIRVREIAGGGGGGGAGGTTFPTGATGGTTSFNSITVIGGSGGLGNGSYGSGGIGGTGGTGTAAFRIIGTRGEAGSQAAGFTRGGSGGNGAFGGGASGPVGAAGATGVAGAANTGGGGSGALGDLSVSGAAGGGGAGEFCEFIIGSPAATYTYTVGAGGAGGIGTGTSAVTGGAGGAGRIIVEEHYNF